MWGPRTSSISLQRARFGGGVDTVTRSHVGIGTPSTTKLTGPSGSITECTTATSVSAPPCWTTGGRPVNVVVVVRPEIVKPKLCVSPAAAGEWTDAQVASKAAPTNSTLEPWIPHRPTADTYLSPIVVKTVPQFLGACPFPPSYQTTRTRSRVPILRNQERSAISVILDGAGGDQASFTTAYQMR